jgi:hypothetical protein
MSSVCAAGQVNVTGGAGVTLNVELHVFAGSQFEVTVKTTVLLPPHASGAPLLLLVITGLQPPLTDAVANQVANLESIVDCV